MSIKVIFMGTPEFSAVSLRALHEAGIEVAAAVTQPDKPQGRGNLMIPSPVKRFAAEHGMPVFQPRRAEEIAPELKALAPDFIVVVAFGQILRRAILDVPAKRCINVHASLLPAYRGASPINWAVIAGEAETGVTTMILDEGMDTGDMLLVKKEPISPDDTAGALHDRLAAVGAELLVETLRGFDEITPQKQDGGRATYAPKLTKDSGRLDWTKSAEEIRNLVRGCDPWPSAFTFHNGVMLKVWKSEVCGPAGNQGSEPGTILAACAGGIDVAAGAGAVRITEVQREGRKRQTVDTFLRGYSLREGERFDAR